MFLKKPIYTLILASFLLPGCASVTEISDRTDQFITKTQVTRKTSKRYPHTPPHTVALLTNEKTTTPHKIIGKIRVNRYNLVGVKRQTAVLNDIMQKRAARLGGNAVIDIKEDNHKKTGKIVRFLV